MGPPRAARHEKVTRYLLDSTVLIAHLRGDEVVARFLLDRLRRDDTLWTSCVGVAEVERGVKPKDRRRVSALLDRLSYLPTTREAAWRAGRYRTDFARRGRTLSFPDALVAGTARAHGAVVLTHDIRDFPMRDLRVVSPPSR